MVSKLLYRLFIIVCVLGAAGYGFYAYSKKHAEEEYHGDVKLVYLVNKYEMSA